MKGYIYLLVAILFEIVGTSMLKLSNGFTNLIPSIILVVSFGLAFLMIALSLKTIPLSTGYSIWAGVGTAGTAVVGVLFFNEILSVINVIGLIIIIIGVVIMNLAKKPELANETG